jgi:hypothetical protein
MTYSLDNSYVNDANQMDLDSYSVVPEGEYIGIPKEIEHKEFKGGSGDQSGYQIKIAIADGSQKGMSVNLFICLKSENDMQLKMAKVNLKKLFIAAGFDSVKNDLSLILDHKIRFSVKHYIKTKNGSTKTYASVDNIFENIMPDGRANTPSKQAEATNYSSNQPAVKKRADAPF